MIIDRRDALAGMAAMFGASLFAPIARAAAVQVTPISSGPPSSPVFTPPQRALMTALSERVMPTRSETSMASRRTTDSAARITAPKTAKMRIVIQASSFRSFATS